ncbi:MAG: glycosyltransferase [Chloroflexota bacterium]
MEKRIGIIMYQTSLSKGQELVAQRMTRYFNKLGQKAYLITSLFHDGEEVASAEVAKGGKGYLFAEDSMLKIPVIRVDSYVTKFPPRRIAFRDFLPVLERIVSDFELNVLITHSTLWNGPEEVTKFVTWRRQMRDLGGYRDPIVFAHMSHFQEPSPQRYSLSELTFRNAWNRLSLSRVMETANTVLVVTPLEKDAKVKMGARADKFCLFPGGVDDEVFLSFATEDTSDFLKRHDINPKARIVSYLGTIEERKNPLAVLRVAERMQGREDLHFVLAGGKDGSAYAEGVERTAKGLPNVTYLGRVDEKEKVQLIRSSYLNIIMSRLEALGIAQIEFMFFGVPIITSATGGQTWLVKDGVEGIHVKGPRDIAGAAGAITQLLEDEGKYKQMSANAREKAGKLTMSRLVTELDTCLDGEMAKESGLSGIPTELQATLARPEYALKSWTVGTYGLVATNRRVFVREGVISRRVTELRYSDITGIEYARRYPWRTLVTGVIISVFLLVAPSLRPLFSDVFVAWVESLIRGLGQLIPGQFGLDRILPFLLPLLPLLVSIALFLIGARSGFGLHGAGLRSIYLPRQFREAIGFIRDLQDKQLDATNR